MPTDWLSVSVLLKSCVSLVHLHYGTKNSGKWSDQLYLIACGIAQARQDKG